MLYRWQHSHPKNGLETQARRLTTCNASCTFCRFHPGFLLAEAQAFTVVVIDLANSAPMLLQNETESMTADSEALGKQPVSRCIKAVVCFFKLDQLAESYDLHLFCVLNHL